METNLSKRVSIDWEITVVVTVQEHITIKDIVIETIVVGEYQTISYSQREAELVGCWCVAKGENVITWKQ